MNLRDKLKSQIADDEELLKSIEAYNKELSRTDNLRLRISSVGNHKADALRCLEEFEAKCKAKTGFCPMCGSQIEDNIHKFCCDGCRHNARTLMAELLREAS